MKTSKILNVLLAIALAVLLIKIAFFSNNNVEAKNPNASDSTFIVLNNIMTRTSIRSYLDKPVEKEKIENMLRAAMAAPSAGNKQPWSFVVIKDRAILNNISENLGSIRMAAKAPLAIVVCGDMTKTFSNDGFDFWVEDVSAASENLLLAAHSMGLGAVWCGIYPVKKNVDFLKKLLQLPENIVPLNVIPIGYPSAIPSPKDKWKPEKIHYDQWNNGNIDKGEVNASSVESPSDSWKKIKPQNLHENSFDLFSNALALTVGNKGKMNSMTIGWGNLGVLWGKKVLTVYVREDRYTNSFMENNDYFTVTALGKESRDALKYLGTVSGRNEDKIKGSGLTLKWTDLGNPAFEEGRLIFECKKIYGAPFDPKGFGELPQRVYKNIPLHNVYIGEIVNVWTK